MGTSFAAYTMGIKATQIVGYCLRISCCTPVLGPCLGLIGVGCASVLAGHVSAHTHKLCQEGGNPLRPGWWRPMRVDDAVTNAVLGLLVYKSAGGRFSSIMPSDLASPGALAFESIPAHGEEYVRPAAKRELARFFRRDGCHHCGTRRGPVIGDHMPPNKLVFTRGASQLAAWFNDLPGIRQVRGLTGATAARPAQRFFAQCQRCSLRQATALRHNKRVLVLHMRLPRQRSNTLAGVLVGLRQNVPPLQLPRAGARPQQQLPLWNPVGLIAALAAPSSVPLLTAMPSSSTVFDRPASCGELDFSPTGACIGTCIPSDDGGEHPTLSLPAVRDPAPPSPTAVAAAARDLGGGFSAATEYGHDHGAAGLISESGGRPSGAGGFEDTGFTCIAGDAVSSGAFNRGASGAIGCTVDASFGRGALGTGAEGGFSRGASGAIRTVPGSAMSRGASSAIGGGVYSIAPPGPEAPSQRCTAYEREGRQEWEAPAAARDWDSAAAAPRWGEAAAAQATAASGTATAGAGTVIAGVAQHARVAPEVTASFQHWMPPHKAGGGGGHHTHLVSPSGSHQRGGGGGGSSGALGHNGSPGHGRRVAQAARPLGSSADSGAGLDAAPYSDAEQGPLEGAKRRAAARASFERNYNRGLSYD
ncbi:hypothetical protein MNEG_4020 [Monoraphidium neglectum]|uniref:Uncharacterized protein n=1 Tax=Monoraphidium neglectum TaxID=145388 RepID=A0A0D2MM96_9CHLO|nr:hypothetical protein MNEG_4020 [Monoraphidium neglectum]KIZ03940.1 hypothetical protein MNEG_4020 [Monoraphidium neglectum]|eukprot:XP_013902959.1 hypothetical protein MNEG_4020 [Monoraphidium neglectum]